MKRVYELESDPSKSATPEVRVAFEKLQALGYRPYLVNRNRTIRVHIKKNYFSYNPNTGGWMKVRRQNNKKWSQSDSLEHFVELAIRANDGNYPPTDRQLGYLDFLCKEAGIQPDDLWLKSRVLCSEAIDSLRREVSA